jgi:hypothetical protein
MMAARKKVLLFVDKSANHPPNTRNVKTVFLPDNCTNMMQPLNLGIISYMTAKYRKALVHKIIAALERKAELKLNVLQALQLEMAAWNLVNSDTVAHCISKAGFGITSHNINVEEDLTDEDRQTVSENQALTFRDFVNCDTDVITTVLQSVEEM